MVAGLAETAAEDLADHLRLLGTDRHVVTEIEMRFLAQNRVTPIVSSAPGSWGHPQAGSSGSTSSTTAAGAGSPPRC